MMRFTAEQYDKAIRDIDDAKGQLEPNGNCCHVCGDSGHQAFECGSNPLLAMVMCRGIHERAKELHDRLHAVLEATGAVEDDTDDGVPRTPYEALQADLHEFLHYLAGHESWMGELVGPAKVRAPKDER